MSDAAGEPPPRSPCISVCVLDDQEICKGCYRSAQEITDWFMADAKEKRAVLRRAQQRRDAGRRVKLS